MNNYTKHFDTFIKKTKHIGLQYNLISPTPTNFSKGGYICQEEWYRPLWAISPKCYSKIKKTEWLAFYDSNLKSIKEFLLKNPKISYIDTFSVICPEIFCKNFDENSIMYRGENHLNSYGAMKLLDTIKSIIELQ